ncbi:NAD-dependent succinate-semialdehyde dehydrogenase [Pradoshia sp. D12]|uniref:NAD-dependent succinate-semialdehyde dehydrogenase n=1 Tax=Bacillaceae TaxID=186817 RepID=UPI00112D9036|nr:MULTISPECIES: NAD-dependent succinate-semialdehyde dehydrogenase [Bacillaceae]QFK72638.1 NAD-dependent succinate-semialdehyde dehydrogenase [Pradoshia sp. D12]TPF71632.1 NAD-dependent succinate-semialdehyde dehydrogenase [Bacillus sp. D12]
MKSICFPQQMYINGEWRDSENTINVYNPATCEVIGSVPNGSESDAKDAVEAAYKSGVAWSKFTAEERSTKLREWSRLIDVHIDELAEIMTLEQGKPFEEAKGELRYANSFITWFAEEGRRVYGETIPASSPNKRIFVQKQPVGVIAAITPWNFPAAMITRKVAPALAAGCTVVLKPSEETPFTALKLIELAEKADIPAGVINIVTGDAKRIVSVWQKDSRVRKITFTGSTEVGKILMKDAADTVKKISLELGGLAPFIVTKHADIEKAVQGAIDSKFRNAGQTCVCANRIFVQQSIMDEFTNLYTEKVKQLKVGNGLIKGNNIGPLINEEAVKKVMSHLDDAKEKGATILTGGYVPKNMPGHFITPAIISGATDDMLCMKEETFGPIAPISVFDQVEEAVERANHTPFGLAAYVFSDNIREAVWIAENLEYGIVGVNDGLPSTAQAPFGGFKESGLGREGSHYGIDEYLEIKYISLGL